MTAPEFELIPGSKYIIHSLGSEKEHMVTEGIFKGYVYLPKDDIGVTIKLKAKNSKKTFDRVIPFGMIMAIDILDEKKIKKKKIPKDTSNYLR